MINAQTGSNHTGKACKHTHTHTQQCFAIPMRNGKAWLKSIGKAYTHTYIYTQHTGEEGENRIVQHTNIGKAYTHTHNSALTYR
jgi:hypothetical protein